MTQWPRFNPRARTGRDKIDGGITVVGHVSIHAPARGATRPASAAKWWWTSFNPRARTGRDDIRLWRRRTPVCFNPRARTGRDAGCPASAGRRHKFQSTRPHGARPCCGCAFAARNSFNPRARTGRDRPHFIFLVKRIQFQSTRPHGARLVVVDACHCGRWFQSTRPHGARPKCQRTVAQRVRVSIHAPARGATCLPACCMAMASFQSTRPHGARPALPCLRPSWLRCFNPRARTGRDAHAGTDRIRRARFNPRARTGRDRIDMGADGKPLTFQSTRPHGARQAVQIALHAFGRFQSTRPHGARRDAGIKRGVAVAVSIHAPARGATREAAF